MANHCLAKDPREDRCELVYDIENSWYGGSHPLTYNEHRKLTNRHKHLLQDYRDKIRQAYDDIEEKEKLLDCNDVYSDSNIRALLEFSKDVFANSAAASKSFVQVSKRIIMSSVEVLEKGGMFAPCHFAVFALGSVGKGEATPYSDLEYAFVVEYDDDYFTKLAVDSYFRIGNFCETYLGSFDISELYHDTLSTLSPPTVGFRIDGITERGANIPTGRVGGQKLILTVDGFMELYQKSAEAPIADLADKSDMLSSSVLQ